MKRIDMRNVKEAGDNTRLTAGGYVCQYTKVEDREDKEYLYMEFDIVEGEFKGYFKDLSDRFGFWGGKCYRSYKEAAKPMFKRMCSAVSKSNGNFVFDGDQINRDERTLVGKYVGIVFQEEEYIGNDGSVKTRLNVYAERPVDDIRSGNFKVPSLKKLEDDNGRETPAGSGATADPDGFMNIPDDASEEMPFN